jgi:CRISPR type I-E-associated protein CasB/Cse2
MTAATEHRDPLVDHLESIAAREDRAALARLRASLQPDRMLEGLPIVLPFVSREKRLAERAEDDALLLASLFALHPESGTTTLPAALRSLVGTSDSVETRFRALLGATRADLGTHLRHAVGLVAGHGIALDWRELHTAIHFWDHSSGLTRRRWARAFWTPDDIGADSDSAS